MYYQGENDELNVTTLYTFTTKDNELVAVQNEVKLNKAKANNS